MNTKYYKITFSIVLTILFSNVFAQENKSENQLETISVVKMRNGDTYYGQIIEQDDNVLVLKNINGIFHLSTLNIESVKERNSKSLYQFDTPNATRYFFGPSAVPIQKEHGYYQNVLVLANFVNYGISKNISIGGGLEFISLLLRNPVWFLTPKIGFKTSKNTHVGVGGLFFGANDEAFALGYGVFTLGHSESNFTIGIGHGKIGEDFLKYPVVMLSGTHRTNNSIALLSENYLIPDTSSNLTYYGIQGLRILSENNSFDVGLVFSPEIIDDILAVPFVGYVRSF